MTDVKTIPTSYRTALVALAGCLREAYSLAELLERFSGVLRGRPADPDDADDAGGPSGPPLELYPTAARLRAALRRLDDARDAAWDAWSALAADEREGLPSPEEVLQP
jgi:hypothetical protein